MARLALPGADAGKAIRGNPIEVNLIGADKRRTKLVYRRNFLIEQASNGVTVVLTQAPKAGVTVTLGQSLGNEHPVGTPVRNISNPVIGPSPFHIRDIPEANEFNPSSKVYIL
ncbi:MAG: hypothetical protein EOP83_21590 [Verrucomicrobiaceae bacterium]|nr:MAG: hypothetical protein EOP83_21590 [Verrucomicrobiaceae bacterium]